MQQQQPAAGGERYSYVHTLGPGGSISGVRRVPASSLPYNYTIPPDILFDEDLAQDPLMAAAAASVPSPPPPPRPSSRAWCTWPVPLAPVMCLQDFGADETLRAMPCAHAFHYDCISQWLRRNASCPLCRHQLLLVMPDDHDVKEEEEEQQHQGQRRRTTAT
ncbi:hypothetical protein HU200_049994 [Digitaria exilis]|uniref:RING-type E3 ubiquitin transferase n=1 Tax=Digitaria exilis TaxID=1010633 RepID=A0A835ANY4_9POAL|nr:hypothetical protein HU200_049994 [Digitaria exilis]CAB3488911.1 unnamed protein product [Digitaria exilis]